LSGFLKERMSGVVPHGNRLYTQSSVCLYSMGEE
jgi:hypothetical protein